MANLNGKILRKFILMMLYANWINNFHRIDGYLYIMSDPSFNIWPIGIYQMDR